LNSGNKVYLKSYEMALQLQGIILFTIILAAGCLGQISNDLEDVEEKIHTIPGLENFNSSQLPSEQDVEKLVREKCEKNGAGEESFNALKNQQTALKDCLEENFNMTQIQEEVEEAKKTGSMDEVFGKYCKKYPEVQKCIEGVSAAVKPCLSKDEQDALDKALKIADELREFVCFKDGDRIAMFIAEGGVECLESKKEELQLCANKTLGARIPTDLSVNSLPTFLFSARDCSDFDAIRTCVNEELEQCKDSTPANIVDAFFKFLKKHMPCDNTFVKTEALNQPSSSPIYTLSCFILVTSLLLVSNLF